MMAPVIADAWSITLPSARISRCESVANKTMVGISHRHHFGGAEAED